MQAHDKQLLCFPGRWDLWQPDCDHATDLLKRYSSEWDVLEKRCKNGAFNAQDTSPLSRDRFYEELGSCFQAKRCKGPRSRRASI